MRRLIFLVSFFFMLQGNASATLIAHYSFDGNADNSAGSYSNGTVYGDVGYSSEGVYGQAASFDGMNDYILLPGDSNMSIGTGDFTVSFWFKTEDSLGYMLDERVSGERGYGLVIYDTQIRFGVQDGAGSYGYNANAVSDPGFNDNQWHLATGVRDGTQISLFIDGILATQDNSGGIVDVGTSNNIWLGKRFSNYTSEDYYNGLMDDLRIYDHALSLSEIQELNGTPVPEPTTMLLLGSSLICLVGARRKSKK